MSEMMIEVPFVRKLPSGNGGIQVIPRSVHIGTMARRFIQAGGWYTVEIMPNRKVRLAACDPGLGELFGCDTENGPPMIDAIDRLIVGSQQFITPAPKLRN